MKHREALKNWTPSEIKRALAESGVNQAAISRAAGVSPVTVSDVVNDRSTSKRIYKVIAEALGRDPEEIWPEKYMNGEPRPGRRKIVWQRKTA